MITLYDSAVRPREVGAGEGPLALPDGIFWVDLIDPSIDGSALLWTGILGSETPLRTAHIVKTDAPAASFKVESPPPEQRMLINGQGWRRFAESSASLSTRADVERQVRSICSMRDRGISLTSVSVSFKLRDTR